MGGTGQLTAMIVVATGVTAAIVGRWIQPKPDPAEWATFDSLWNRLNRRDIT